MLVNDVLTYLVSVGDVWAYLSILPLICKLAFSRSGMLTDRELPATISMDPVTFRNLGRDRLDNGVCKNPQEGLKLRGQDERRDIALEPIVTVDGAELGKVHQYSRAILFKV
jgi:hypothetical protein